MVACSGGPDSTCLLDVLIELKDKYDLKLIVAHVNYGLRGKDSDRDEKFVRELAEKHGLKIEVIRPKNIQASEDNLRNARYIFFEKVRAENNFDYIAVGHTLDDQAETFLMRIIRGSGLAGMSAMKHKNGRVIRPLLGITKSEILEYLKARQRPYRTDKTNKEVSCFRNKIRNELIPLLEKKYNPNIKAVLCESSLTVADDYDLIKNQANMFLKKTKGMLSVKKILKLHPSLQKKVVIRAIEKKRKNLKNIQSGQIREVIKIIKSAKNKNQVIKFQGLKIERKGDRIFLSLSNKN